MGYVSFHRHRHLAVNSSFYTFRAARLKITGLTPVTVFLVIISILRAPNVHHRPPVALIPLSSGAYLAESPVYLTFSRCLSSASLFPFSEPEVLFFPRPTPSSYLRLCPIIPRSPTRALLCWPPFPLPAVVTAPALFPVQPPDLERVCCFHVPHLVKIRCPNPPFTDAFSQSTCVYILPVLMKCRNLTSCKGI